VLTIEEVSQKDEGFYMCQVNSEPMLHQISYLRVISPPIISDVETTTDLNILENENAKIKCVAKGNPRPSISWNINGRFRDDMENKSNILLTNITRYDMGTILCIARNGVPPTQSKLIKLHVNFKPEIRVHTDVIGSLKRLPIHLQCKIQGFPDPIIYWSGPFGNVVVNNNHISTKQTKLSNFSFLSVLSIKSLTDHDFGHYTCSAKNTIGTCSKTIKLYRLQSALNTTIRKDFDGVKRKNVLTVPRDKLKIPHIEKSSGHKNRFISYMFLISGFLIERMMITHEPNDVLAS